MYLLTNCFSTPFCINVSHLTKNKVLHCIWCCSYSKPRLKLQVFHFLQSQWTDNFLQNLHVSPSKRQVHDNNRCIWRLIFVQNFLRFLSNLLGLTFNYLKTIFIPFVSVLIACNCNSIYRPELQTQLQNAARKDKLHKVVKTDLAWGAVIIFSCMLQYFVR